MPAQLTRADPGYGVLALTEASGALDSGEAADGRGILSGAGGNLPAHGDCYRGARREGGPSRLRAREYREGESRTGLSATPPAPSACRFANSARPVAWRKLNLVSRTT